MKLNIKKYKLTNLYLFISELSQWNELLCVVQRKKEWLKKTGQLTSQEKEALKEFSKIFIDAPNNLELIFLFKQPKNIWLNVQKQIGKEKTDRLKQIFKLFELRFNKLWPKEKIKLDKIEKLFKASQQTIEQNLSLILNLCGLKKSQLPKSVEIILLLNSSREEAQGWSYQSKIILECSNWPINKINYLINCIFLHELFHLLIKKNKKIFKTILSQSTQIQKYLPKKLKQWQPKIILEDAVISSFLPEGYLAERFCNIKVKKEAQKEIKKKSNDDFTKLRNQCAFEMYETAKEYVEKNKKINEKYIEAIVECIKKGKRS